MYNLLADLLTETNAALGRLDQAPGDRAALSRLLQLVRALRQACAEAGLRGPEQVARSAEAALGRVRAGALADAPDLVTGLLRALDHVGILAADPSRAGPNLDGNATGVIQALDAVAADRGRVGVLSIFLRRPGGAASPPARLPPQVVPVLIVEAAGRRFALPRAGATEASRSSATPAPASVKLASLLRLPRTCGAGAGVRVVVTTTMGASALNLAVDRVLGAEDAAVRPIAPTLRCGPMFGGSATLGDGAVVMLLAPDGIASALRAGRGTPAAPVAAVLTPGAGSNGRRPARARSDGQQRVTLVEDGDFARPTATTAPVEALSRARP